MNEFLPNYAPQLRPEPSEDLTFGDLMGTAFRQENDMLNLAERFGRTTPPMDPEFDVLERGQQSDLWNDHYETLARAQSEAEFDQLESRLVRETKDRQLLASQGLKGMLAGMGAGVFSPVMFIPLVGQARGARGVAQAFGLAAAAAGGQEAALMANQLTRTTAEAAVAVGAGTVLGGLLGTTAMMLRRTDLERLADDLNPNAPNTPRNFVVRNPDGSITRVGDDVPLQMPVGIARTPAAALEITAVETQGAAVRTAARREGLPGLQRIAADDAADPVAREMATEVLNARFDQARLASMAENAGLPGPIARSWARFEELTEQVARRDVPPERAEMARREFAEALEALQPQQRHQIEQVLPRISREADNQAARLVDTAIEERTAPLRATEEEVAYGTGMGGSAGAKVSAEQFEPVLHYVDPETGEVITQNLLPEGVPLTPGTTRSATPVGDKMKFVNPVIRTIDQPNMPVPSQQARQMMRQLSDGGVGYEGARFGISPTPEGTVEHRIGYYYGLLGKALRVQYEGYIKYLGKEQAGFIGRRGIDAQILFNMRPPGKMTFVEFKEQVTHARNLGMKHDVPEVAEIARTWQEEFFDPINTAMLEATEDRGYRALYEIMEAAPDKSYFTHIFDIRKISSDRDGFIEMVADHWQNQASSVFSRRWQRLMQREEGELAFEDILRMTREEAAEELKTTTDALNAAPRASDLDPRVDEIRTLRDRAREMREEETERLIREQTETRGRPLETEEQRAAERLARQNVKEEYDALRVQADELEAQLPEQVTGMMDETRRLRARQRAINQSFGRMEQRQQELFDRIDRNENMNLRALDRLLARHRTFMRDMDRMSDERLDTELRQLERQFDRVSKQIDNGEQRINNLYERYGPQGSDFEPTERLSIEQARQALRETRLENTFGRLDRATQFDRDAARAAIQQRLDAAISYTNRVNNQRAVRNQRLTERAEQLNPEQVGARIEGMRAARTRAWEEFEQSLIEAGVDDFDLQAGSFDFSETARNLALDLSHRITGNPTRIGQLDIMPELRGPMKQRMLNIPYEQKQRFLDLDSERVLGRYTRSIGADIELFRAFGSVGGKNALQNVQRELQEISLHLARRTEDEAGKPITEARRARDLKAHAAGTNDIMRSLEGTIDRARGLRGLPTDPTALPYRLGRFLIHMNTPTMMGVAMVTSIPDAGRAVMAHGLTHTFRTAWMPLVRGLIDDGQMQINKAVIDELKLHGIGIEVFSQQRAKGAFEIMADTPGQTAIERGAEWLAQKTPQVALFGPWTDWNKSIAGMATMARVLTQVQELTRGTIRQAELQYLADIGINPDMARRIAAQLEESGTRARGIILPNTESWTDYQALRTFYSAMHRESDRMVISPGFERPMMMDANILGRMAFQFRSFTMAAHSKMLLSGLQSRDMALFNALQGTIFSLGLGTLSYYIWAVTTGGRAYEDMKNASWETWIDQALYRSGMLGALSELQMVGSEMPLTRPYVNFAGSDLAGRRANSLMGAALGPSFGKAWDIATFLQQIDEPTQTTTSQARKLIPYQNVFWLRQGLNAVEDGFNSTFNIPERRQ